MTQSTRKSQFVLLKTPIFYFNMTKEKISLNLRRIINFFVCTAMPGYEKVFFTPKYRQREPKQSKRKKETKTLFLP